MGKLALLLLAFVTMACGDDPYECTAATEGTDCGAHQYCNESDAGRTCECVAGYESGAGGCAWTGTIQDPELAMASVWTPVNGAVMDTGAAGGADPGEARFSPEALCSLAHVKQTVEMPAFAKAEPLVLELSYKNPAFLNGVERVLMGVSFGDRWSPFPSFNDANFHSMRICLPEGGYAPRGTTGRGAPVTFSFGPFEQSLGCPDSMISGFAVDHAAIVAANEGECGATFGQGVNFDAEGSGGWTFNATGGSSGGFAAGIGANGTRGARLLLNLRCEKASLETAFNVPDIANPAFEMFVGAGPGANTTLAFLAPDRYAPMLTLSPFEMVMPVAQSRTLHMCLPPWMRGQTMSLSFEIFSSALEGSCTDVMNHQAIADDVRVVDDPACGASDSFTDAGFEQGAAPWGAFGLTRKSTAGAVVRDAPDEAQAGTRYLALESHGRCSKSGYTMMPIVPAPNGPIGPALKFFASVGANPDASTTVQAQGSAMQTLAEGSDYRQYTVCLNPLYAGRPQSVFLRHDGGGGQCDNSNYVQQNAFIDTIEVTTDAACPAQ